MPNNAPHNALSAAVNRVIANGSPVITEQRALFIPPSVHGVIAAISPRGYSVSVRQTRNGSNRYSVNGARETDALTLIKRFDAGKFSRDLNEEMLDNFNWVGSRHHY